MSKSIAALPQAVSAGRRSAVPECRWLAVGANLDPRFGGVSAVMAPLSRSVTACGDVSLSLAAFCGPGENLDAARPVMTETRVYPLRGLRALIDRQNRAGLALQISRSAGVHIHGLWQEHCALAARIARDQGKPYIISPHGMLDPWALRAKRLKKSTYLRLIEQPNLQGAACLHALTPFEAETCRRFAPRVPIAVIPNGADAPGHADPEIFFRRFPHLRGKRIVLFLARLHPKKGLDILLEAWQTASLRQPNAHLVLAGPDCEGTRGVLEARVRALRLENRVTFTGMLAGADKWSALAAADLFVLPSYSEGLSVSVLEAMAMSRPVLVTEQCHVSGIAQARCGWVIQPRAAEIEGALDRFFLSTPAEIERMGASGQSLARSAYSWNSVGERMAAVYRWLSGGARPQQTEIF